MTEAEWLSCVNPEVMLRFRKGAVSERKLRLFDCACCRVVWHLLDRRARKPILLLEDLVEGAVTREVFAKARAKLSWNYSYTAPARRLKGTARDCARTAGLAVWASLNPENPHRWNPWWSGIVHARYLEENEE